MTNRIAVWDNARLIMLVLVVSGHMIEGIRSEGITPYWFYTFIYLFHMPVMMFISGYFSRAEVSWKAAYSVFQLISAYIVWEILIGVVRFLLTGWTPSEHFLTTPSWAMWFLISLACLKVLLPFVMQLRHPLLATVILSLASGAFLDIDTTFSVSRTLGFMPFFVAGHIAREKDLLGGRWFQSPTVRVRTVAGALLAVVGTVLWLLLRASESSAIYRWAFHRDNYWETTLSSASRIEILPGDEIVDSYALVVINGVLVTALFMALAAAIGIAVLLVIPRSQSMITGMGQNTLYIYLLHIPIVRVVTHFDVVPSVFSALGLWGFALILIASVILTGVLGSPVTKKLFRPIIEPNVSSLMRQP